MAHSKGGFFITKAKRDFLGCRLAVTPATIRKLQLFASVLKQNSSFFFSTNDRKKNAFFLLLLYSTLNCIYLFVRNDKRFTALLNRISFEIHFRVYNSFKMSITLRHITFAFSFYYFRDLLTQKFVLLVHVSCQNWRSIKWNERTNISINRYKLTI